MYIGLAFSFIYFAVTIAAFSYVFSPNQWLKMFHVDRLVDDMANKTASMESSGESKSTNENKYRKTTEAYKL
jgi:hypothetical protein